MSYATRPGLEDPARNGGTHQRPGGRLRRGGRRPQPTRPAAFAEPLTGRPCQAGPRGTPARPRLPPPGLPRSATRIAPPRSASARVASPTVPSGFRSPTSQENEAEPCGATRRSVSPSSSPKERARAASDMRTRSGRRCIIMAVSTAPPWMPWRHSPLREVRVFRRGKTEPACLHDQHSQLVAKPETGGLQRVPVPAVAVAQHEPPHSDLREGLARRLDQSGELIRLERERSWETSHALGCSRSLAAAEPRRESRPAAAGTPPRASRARSRDQWRGAGGVRAARSRRRAGRPPDRSAQSHLRPPSSASATTGPPRQPWFEGSVSRA